VTEAFGWPMRMVGAASLAGGLWMAVQVLLMGKGAGEAPPVILFLAGTVLISLGLFLTEAQWLLGRRAPELNWRAFWGGLLVSQIGTLLMVVSCADPHDEAFSAPRWVVAVIGLLLTLWGVLILRTAPPKYREGGPPTTVGAAIVALMLTCAGTVFSFAAFGPGKREFEGEMSVPFLSLPFPANEYVGRAIFGLVALLFDAFALAGWAGLLWGAWHGLKERRKGRGAVEP
jgi:hypothetical protein